MLSLIKIGPSVLEKKVFKFLQFSLYFRQVLLILAHRFWRGIKMKMWKVRRRIQYRRTGRASVRLKKRGWVFWLHISHYSLILVYIQSYQYVLYSLLSLRKGMIYVKDYQNNPHTPKILTRRDPPPPPPPPLSSFLFSLSFFFFVFFIIIKKTRMGGGGGGRLPARKNFWGMGIILIILHIYHTFP